MSGFVMGGPIDSLAIRETGLDRPAPTTGDVLGAEFGQALHDNPIAGLYRLGHAAIVQGTAEHRARRGLEPEEGHQILTADQANERFPFQGKKLFTAPVVESIARDIYDAQIERAHRSGLIERREGGIATGMAARFLTQVGASALDPLNIASAFIPVAPAARVSAWLASQGGAAGRAGVRAAVGAGQGAVGALVLEPIVAAAQLQEGNDYTMGNAALNIAVGATLGAALNPLVGRFSAEERAFSRPRVSDAANEAAMRDALVAHVDGRPVVSGQVAEAVEAARAREEMMLWARQAERLGGETDAVIARTSPEMPPDWAPVTSRAREHLEILRSETEKLREEIAGASNRAVRNALDPATAERLGQIEGELGRAIPRARRESLEQERTMLLEGRNDVPMASDDLEVARSIAEQRGLKAELARATERERRAEIAAETTEAAERQAREAGEADARDAGGLWEIESSRISSRAEIVERMAERTLRRYAAGQGASVSDDELRRMAVRAVMGGDDEIRAVMGEIDGRAGAPYTPGPDRAGPDQSGVVRMGEMAAKSERDAVAAARQADPRLSESVTEAERLRTEAPQATGTADEQVAQLAKEAESMATLVKAEQQAGRLKPGADAELKAADARAALAESDAKALDAAGMCMAVTQ